MTSIRGNKSIYNKIREISELLNKMEVYSDKFDIDLKDDKLYAAIYAYREALRDLVDGNI